VTRPAIAVTIENPRQEPEVFRLREDYVRSVETAGGLPLIFAPGRPQDAGEVLDHVDGLLLTGGADVDPKLYGETPHPKLGPTFEDRDAFELALCREALRRDLPILAICRGHQVLNVATGGTLVRTSRLRFQVRVRTILKSSGGRPATRWRSCRRRVFGRSWERRKSR